MQTVSSVLETALRKHEDSTFGAGGGSFALKEVVEVYSSSYTPHITNGYQPSAAEKRWSSILGFTFLSQAYEREYIDRGDIHRFQDKREGNVTLNFSNISRQLAAWVQSTDIEGKQVVIRVIADTSTVIADSLVIFTGRLDKPGDFDDESGSLTATQRFGQINQQFPYRTFGPNDSKARAPNDPLFEGFRITAQTQTVLWTSRARRQDVLGLFGVSRTLHHSYQASSKSEAIASLAVPDAFGRVQLYGTYLGTLDIGGAINFSMAVCEGGEEGIDSYIFIRQTNPKFTQISANPAMFYGYPGDTGPVGREQKPIRILNPSVPNHPGDGYHSMTAWFAGFVSGSSVDIDEAEAPDWMILIKAKRIKVADGSGVFTNREWTDNPAYIARHLLSHERYFNEGESAIEDPVCYATGLRCAEMVLDKTKGEWVYVPEADAALLGTEFTLLRSTGLVDSRRVRMLELGSLAGDPHETLAEIEPFDPGDPPDIGDTPTNTNLRAEVLRVRHTCNVTLLERMSGLDFLYNVVAPTGRLFFRRNGKGKIEIHTEKPADNTRLRTNTSVGATVIPVHDVDPWKIGPLLLTQKLLIGNTQITSEVRTPSAANYTTDANAITLTSSGSGLTATASGATLTGGSSSVAASGTVTLSGTPNAGDSVTITINGLAYSYTLDSFDTLESAANLCAKYINAIPKLNAFLKATSSGTVITITAKWGTLTVSALANTHTAEVASPTTAPTLAAAAGGILPGGTYYVGYAWRTAIGLTALSLLSSVVVTANQKINVTGLGALPGGVSSVDWFVSKYANNTEMVLWANNDGTAFSIGTSAPVSSNDLPPDTNESGEELLRVAMSFSSNDQGATVLAQTGLLRGNIHKGSYKWPLPGKQSSTNLVTGTFFDSTEDYAPTPLEVHDYAHQTQIRKVNKKEVDLSGFDNYSQASRQLNFILSKHREGDWFNSLSAGPYAMLLEEGDIICGSSDNGGVINVVTRAEEISIGKAPAFTTKITGRKYSTRMFSDNVRQHNIRLPTTLRTVTPLPSEIEFIDNFPIRDQDGLTGGFYVAVAHDLDGSGSWRGWQLWADYGDGYAQIYSNDVPASMGTATTTLGSVTDPSLWDRTNSLTFTIVNAPPFSDAPRFTSATEQDLLANSRRNLFLVGDEYLQAATVVDNGGESYTISTFLRGRFGTDSHQLTHGASERVIYLNGAENFIPIDITRLNGPFNYKAVTVNQNVADASPHSFTWTGGNLKPLSPVNLRGKRDSLGNLLIKWTRRSRLSPGLTSGTDVPLAEEAEQYEVEILTSGNVLKRTIPVGVGISQAAILLPTPELRPELISGNNILAGGPVGAGSVEQPLTNPGSWVEATLNAPTGYASIYLIPHEQVPLIFTGYFSGFTQRVMFAQTATPIGLTVTEDAVTKFSSSVLAVNSVRIRILLSGTEVRYYWDYTGPGSVPFYISRVAPTFPLAAVVQTIGTTASIGNVTVMNAGAPSTVYSVNQQTEDFGSAQNPIRVRVYQISSVVGRGDYVQGDL